MAIEAGPALGLKADSSSLVVATEDLKKLSKAAHEAQGAADALAKGTDRLRDAKGRFIPAGKQATDQVEKFDKVTRGAEGAASRFAVTAAKAAGALAGLAAAAVSVSAYTQMADSWSDMQSVVGAAIKDMEAAPALMKRIADLAAASYSPLEQTARSFASNAGALRDLGLSTDAALDYTEALNHALVITATKGERAASVQNALSKAMAIGKLQAEGLETVLANGGRVAEALAKELDVNVSALRKLASEGKITGDVIAKALTGELENLRAEAAEMPATIGDAFQLIRNAALEAVGVFDQTGKISESLAERLVGVAEAIRSIEFAAWAERAANAITLLGNAIIVLAATRIPALLAAMAAINASNVLLVAGFVAMRVQALAAGGAMRLMTMLGGPIGLLAAGVTALGIYLWNSAEASKAAAEEMQQFDAALRETAEGARLTEQQISKLTETQVLASLERQRDALRDMAKELLNAANSLADDAGRGGDWYLSERITALTAQFQQGEITLNMYRQGLDALGRSSPEFVEAISGILDSLSQAETAAEGIARSEAILRVISGTASDADRAMLGLAVSTQQAAAATVELTAEQEKAAQSARDMLDTYQRRAELARIEQQYGRDSAQYLSAQLTQERAIQHAKIDALDISRQQKAELKAQYDEMMRLEARTQGWAVEVGKLSPPLQKAYDWLVKISETQPGAGWLDTAISKAATLATTLWDAVSGMGALTATEVDAAGNAVTPGTSGVRPRAAPSGIGGVDWGVDPGAGSGGGGGSDQYASNLQSLIESLQTQQATIDAWYVSSQEILADRRAQEILGAEEHNNMMLALENEYMTRVQQAKDAARQHEVSAQNAMYNELSGLLGSFAGKSKAAAIAQIAINTALRFAEATQSTAAAQMRALAELGPIAGAAAAAKIAAFGAVQKGLILAAGAAQGLGSRSGGGGGGSAPASSASSQTAAAQPAAPLRVSVDAFDTNQLYTGAAVQQLFTRIQEEAGNRGIIWVPTN